MDGLKECRLYSVTFLDSSLPHEAAGTKTHRLAMPCRRPKGSKFGSLGMLSWFCFSHHFKILLERPYLWGFKGLFFIFFDFLSKSKAVVSCGYLCLFGRDTC